MITIYYLFVYY